MKKQQITLLGETLTIVFNMACQIAFEEITGKPFSDFDSKKAMDIFALDYAVISVNNPDTNITADRLMREANAQDMKVLNNAITASLMDWNDMPATLADDEDAPAPSEDSTATPSGESPSNDEATVSGDSVAEPSPDEPKNA